MPDPGVETVEIESEALLYYPDRTTRVAVNAGSALIWSCLDGKSTVGEIATDLAQHFGVPLEAMLADVTAAVTDLARRGMVDDASNRTAASWTRSRRSYRRCATPTSRLATRECSRSRSMARWWGFAATILPCSLCSEGHSRPSLSKEAGRCRGCRSSSRLTAGASPVCASCTATTSSCFAARRVGECCRPCSHISMRSSLHLTAPFT